MLTVTLLSENCTRKKGILAEHGLSMWIEKEDFKLLFDTGESNVYIKNASGLGIDISDAEYVFLSHGHYDHGGGLPYLFNTGIKAMIYTHPGVLRKKYSYDIKTGNYRYSGINAEGVKDKFKFNSSKYNMKKDIILSGEIPMVNDFERIPGHFYIEVNGEYIKDDMIDEQMLIILDDSGIHLFSGCGHRGIVNSIEYVKKLFPGRKVLSVTGGFHLNDVSFERISMTVEYFLKERIERVIPIHCTGFEASAFMKQKLGDICEIHNAGDKIIF